MPNNYSQKYYFGGMVFLVNLISEKKWEYEPACNLYPRELPASQAE